MIFRDEQAVWSRGIRDLRRDSRCLPDLSGPGSGPVDVKNDCVSDRACDETWPLRPIVVA